MCEASDGLLSEVRNHLWVFVNCLIENPAFDSQTKAALGSAWHAWISEVFTSAKCVGDVDHQEGALWVHLRVAGAPFVWPLARGAAGGSESSPIEQEMYILYLL